MVILGRLRMQHAHSEPLRAVFGENLKLIFLKSYPKALIIKVL